MKHITRTPGICGGEPCIAGTRITTRHVWEAIHEGRTMPWLMFEYGIHELQILDAVAFELTWHRRLGRRVEAARQRLGRWLLDE